MHARAVFAASLLALLIWCNSCHAQLQSRWRDQRAPGSKSIQFLNIFAATSSPGLLYQSSLRPQLELQQQVQTQRRSIDRLNSAEAQIRTRMSSNRTGGTGLGDQTTRTTAGQKTAFGINAGHPTYFFRRDTYYPRFQRLNRN